MSSLVEIGSVVLEKNEKCEQFSDDRTDGALTTGGQKCSLELAAQMSLQGPCYRRVYRFLVFYTGIAIRSKTPAVSKHIFPFYKEQHFLRNLELFVFPFSLI